MSTRKSKGLLHLKGAIRIIVVVADKRPEATKHFQPFSFAIRNAISGANAMLCGLDRAPTVKEITEYSILESRIRTSVRMRKNVYTASNWPQIDVLKMVAGLNAYREAARIEGSKWSLLLKKTNMRIAVAMSKRFEGNLRI